MRTKLWIGVGAFVIVQSGSAVAIETALPAPSAFADQVGEGEYEGGEQEGGEQEAGEGEGEGREKVVRSRKARSVVRNPRRARMVARQSGERGESEGGEQEGGENEGGEYEGGER